MAARSKAWVYGSCLAVIADSNSAGALAVSLSCLLYVVRYRSLRRADHCSRGILPIVVCLSVIEEHYRGGLGQLGLSNHEEKTCIFTLTSYMFQPTYGHLQAVQFYKIVVYFANMRDDRTSVATCCCSILIFY
jgi:hypothetical protein